MEPWKQIRIGDDITNIFREGDTYVIHSLHAQDIYTVEIDMTQENGRVVREVYFGGNGEMDGNLKGGPLAQRAMIKTALSYLPRRERKELTTILFPKEKKGSYQPISLPRVLEAVA